MSVLIVIKRVFRMDQTKQPGHDTNLIVNFDDPFCFPWDLFVEHPLDIQANRAISYDVSFLYGEVDFRFPQT